MAGHKWRPVEEVGVVVSFDESMLTNLTPEFIDESLEAAGDTSLLPVPCGVRNFQFRYVTQDKGEIVEATALLGIPICDEPMPEPLPVVLWLHGTTGAMDDCAPSKDPLAGPAQTTVISSQGFISIAPDYIGMLGFGAPSPEGTIHSYLVGEATAIASLDSVRAAMQVLAEDDELPDADPGKVAVWGGSQGGHAAFFTELFQPYYAPEISIPGVFAGVPPTDVLAECAHALQSKCPGSAALGGALVAMAKWYGHFDKLGEVFTDTEPAFVATEFPKAMAEGCSATKVFNSVTTLDQAFQDDFLTKGSQGLWDDLYPWGCMLKENSVGFASVPHVADTPFLATFSENDELVYTPIELEAMTRLCSEGYRIEQVLCAGASHSQGAVQTLPYAFDWTWKRVNGEPWNPDVICSTPAPADCTKL